MGWVNDWWRLLVIDLWILTFTLSSDVSQSSSTDDEPPLKVWWFKYKGARHRMMFINECMYLSDQDSDTVLHRLLSEPVLLNMNLEWSVNLLIKSQLWLHSWKFSTIFIFVEKRELRRCRHWSPADKHDSGQRGGWNVIINHIYWVVTECSNLTHLIGCKYSMK